MVTVREQLTAFLKRQSWLRGPRLANIARRTLHGGYPDWKAILGDDWERWQAILRDNTPSTKVLVATSIGAHLPSATLESLLGVSLTLRSAHVEFLLCDAALTACMRCESNLYPNSHFFALHGPAKDLCKVCCAPATNMFRELGFFVHHYGQFLTDEDKQRANSLAQTVTREELTQFEWEGVHIGEHALSGALRYFARANLEDGPNDDRILRRFFESALLTGYSAGRLLNTNNYDVVVAHHGIYVPQGVICDVAKSLGVRVVTWHQAYREKTFIFSHGDTYHHTMMSEPTDDWLQMKWSPELARTTTDYLESRHSGKNDWIAFQKNPVFNVERFIEESKVAADKPWVLLLTNVVWDAQLHYPSNAFGSMLEWVVDTVRYFQSRSDLQLLIRVHPAEVYGTIPSRQLVEHEIAKVIPRLPENVLVISPNNPISTYRLAERSNAALIFGTKMGVELTSMGIPVIVAGEAWIRGKGLTRDVCSREEYALSLAELPYSSNLSKDQVERAKKYAFHFFFRRMIPLEFMQPKSGWPPYRIGLSGLDSMAPGASRGLDVISDGILRGAEFVYPAESFY